MKINIKKNNFSVKFFFFFFFFFPFLVFSEIDVSDYKFYKILQGTTFSKTDNIYFKINQHLYDNSLFFLSDLKIIRSDGKKIPYKKRSGGDIITYQVISYPAKIISVRQISENVTEYILHINNTRFHNKLQVISDSKNFLKEVYIYGSPEKDGVYRNLNLDKNNPETFFVNPARNDLFIDYKFNNYEYLKLIISPTTSNFSINKFMQKFIEASIQKGAKKTYEAKITLITVGQQDIYLFDLRKNIFIEKLNISFIEQIFEREYLLLSSNNKNSKNWETVSSGKIVKTLYQQLEPFIINNNKRFHKLIINNKKEEERLNLFSTSFETFYQKVFLPNDLNFEKYQYKVYYGTTIVNFPQHNFRINNHNKNNVELLLSAVYQNTKYNPAVPEWNFLKKYYIYIIIISIFNLFLILISWLYITIRIENKNKRKKGWTTAEKKEISKK